MTAQDAADADPVGQYCGLPASSSRARPNAQGTARPRRGRGDGHGRPVRAAVHQPVGTDQRADPRPAADHRPRPADPPAPFPAPACPPAGKTGRTPPPVRHLTHLARHLTHDTARNARFSIGIVNAAYIGIFSVGQQAVRPDRERLVELVSGHGIPRGF
jgi:hypothetical protein